MPRKPKVNGRKIGRISEEQMKNALEEISKGKSIRCVSKEKNIPFATLYRYTVKMKDKGSLDNMRLTPNYAVNKIFNLEQEQALKEYFEKCALMFYGLSTKDCRKVAYEMAAINNLKMPSSWTENRLAGIDWLKAFRQRHSDISLRRPEACSLARATAFNRHTVNSFYDNLQTVYHRNSCFADGTRVFNLDETATTTLHKPQRVIAPKGKNVNKVTSGERGILVTTCLIVCAAGYALPPVLIFPRKKFKDHMIKGAPPGSLGLATPTGWMNNETFVQTISHFIKRTSSSIDNPSLLIMDNHESHLSIEALDLAKVNGVTILTLHPHTTAKMQPLDVGVNSPFKGFYNAEIDSWMMRNPGKVVTIYDLAELIGNAFNKAMTPTNITNAFKKTGIFPFDRNIFNEDDFLPSSVTDRPDPEISFCENINIESDQGSPSILQNTVEASSELFDQPRCSNIRSPLTPSILQNTFQAPSELLDQPGCSNIRSPLTPSILQNTFQAPSELFDQPGCSNIRSPLTPSILQNTFQAPSELLNQPGCSHIRSPLTPSILQNTFQAPSVLLDQPGCSNIRSPLTPSILQNTFQAPSELFDQPGCSNIRSTLTSSTSIIKPAQFRAPIKAAPRIKTRKRKPGRSIIATDTPEKEAIRVQKEESKRKKASKNKKTVVRKVLSQDESDSEADIENISIHDEDSDWCGEDETDAAPLTDEQLHNTVLSRIPMEGDYVLVRFDTKRRSIYYVAKILHNRNENLEYYVSYLRVNRKHQFTMPIVADLAYVREHDLKLILPKPNVGGS